MYGRAGRLTAENGGFRPGQWTKRLASLPIELYHDDGFGAGTRGLLSYDDGSTFHPDAGALRSIVDLIWNYSL